MKKILSSRFFQFGLALIAGLFISWLFFSSDSTTEHQHSSEQVEETTYTCSMHPQIRQNKPGKCPICGMDLIPVTKGTNKGASSPLVHAMSQEALALANVQTQKVKAVSPEHEIYLTGKVAINEQQLAVLTANYSGRVEKLFIDFTGQKVRKGQRLANIYSPELVTAQKELIEASKYKDINPALYNAVKEKLRLWKITQSQIAQIEGSGVVLTELDIYSDKSGIVIRREIAKGDYVSKGMVLFEIADLGTLWLLLDAYESDLPFIKIGQKISFTVSSVPGRKFTSSISFIDPLINQQTRTASVRAVVENTQQILKPEMFVKAIIKADLYVKEKSLIVPKTSVLWTGKRSIVYVKVPDAESPAFEMREIALGASSGEFYIVENGLAPGEEIVTNGLFAIDAAAQLSGNISMMNRAQDNTLTAPDKFTEQLTEFFNQYFEVKNSLVQGDFQLSHTNVKILSSALNRVDMNLLANEAHNVWMQHYMALKKQTELFVDANDINKQREVLSVLSDQMIEIADIFRLEFETLFVAYCPMALDNKGAYWLSEFEEIKNPYFGDAMPGCGEVRKKIRKHM